MKRELSLRGRGENAEYTRAVKTAGEMVGFVCFCVALGAGGLMDGLNTPMTHKRKGLHSHRRR